MLVQFFWEMHIIVEPFNFLHNIIIIVVDL
jgi:hypothetical protein